MILSHTMRDYEVLWQEYEAPPVGRKRGSWTDHSEFLETADEALDLMLLLREERARRVTMRRRDLDPDMDVDDPPLHADAN